MKISVDDVLESAFEDPVGAMVGAVNEIVTLFFVGEVGHSIGAVFVAGFVEGDGEGVLVCHLGCAWFCCRQCSCLLLSVCVVLGRGGPCFEWVL